MLKKKFTIIAAPNSFKGSLDAVKAATAIEKAFLAVSDHFEVIKMPIADGGDYFMEVMTHALGGELQQQLVQSPIGQPVQATFGVARKTGIIEMAKASGLALLTGTQLNPSKTTSFGTGELMRHAIELGCNHLILGIGGSATNDAGVGILAALGYLFLDEEGKSFLPTGGNLSRIATVDTSQVMPELRHVKISVACDVENPLLGENGCAAVFAPQKGASAKQVAELEKQMISFAGTIQKSTGKAVGSLSKGGAAGGIAAGLNAFLGAQLVNGIDLVMEQLQFAKVLKSADLVITSEGKLDLQTLEGKGPYGIAQKAKTEGVAVIALGGSIPSEHLEGFTAFDALFSIVNGPISLSEAMENGEKLLTNTVTQIAKLLMLNNK